MPCIILQDPENHDKKNSDIAPDSERDNSIVSLNLNLSLN